jgi:thiamine biosynthesis lipoprotein
VRRLERQFSLYRTDFRDLRPEPEWHSGRSGADMVALLKASLQFSDLTDGAFDPTVQPLCSSTPNTFSSEKAGSRRSAGREADGGAGEIGPQWPCA